jgi:hypothetical protein
VSARRILLLPVCALVTASGVAVPADASAHHMARNHRFAQARSAQLTSVSPAHGDVSGRERVRLSGSFRDVRAVWFGSKKAPTFHYQGPRFDGVATHLLLVTAPQHRSGKVHVRVQTKSGFARSTGPNTFVYRNDGAPKMHRPVPPGTVGAAYTGVLATTDSRRGTWQIVSGRLPAGLELHRRTGLVSGIPTTAGKAHPHVGFVDLHGRATRAEVSIDIAPETWTERTFYPHNSDVACHANTCYATDTGYDDSDGSTSPELFAESNSAWEPLTLSNPSGGNVWSYSEPTSISCGSHGLCAMVGNAGEDVDEGDVVGGFLAMPADDSRWDSTRAPIPSGESAARGTDLESVACGAEACAAVGELNPWDYPDGPTSPALGTPLVEEFTAGTWKASSPDLTGTDLTGAVLTAVSCLANGDCMAAGVGRTARSETRLVTVHIPAEGRPTIADAPLPSAWSKAVWVIRIGCSSASSCVLLGTTGNQLNGPTAPFFSWLHNGSWTTHRFPAPRDVGAASLEFGDLACSPGVACYVVGSGTHHGWPQPVVEVFAASGRYAYRALLPAGNDDSGRFTSVACRSNGNCIAGAGYRYLATGQPGAAIAHLGAHSVRTKQVALAGPGNARSGTASVSGLACDDVCAALTIVAFHLRYTSGSLTTAS